MNLNTIKSEGSLISADLLEEIRSGDAPGQRSGDFGLNGKVRLIDEVAACWSDAKAYWDAFQHGMRRVKEGESGATPTRELWILPLLRTLGFEGIAFNRAAFLVGGRSYSISHRIGDEEHPLPIHVEGANFEIDKRTPTGRPRISPHALVQEYLNRTDALWGIVTNGYQLRVLRDSARLSRPTYLEFDLKQMMEGEHFTDFQVLYRIIHRTRWPRESATSHDCLLEQYYQHGIETGGRVREKLRDGVEEALKIFGNGFLEHPHNSKLLEDINEGRLSASEFYRQLLRLIYRFLFLMVSEDRKLVGPDPENDKLYSVYTEHYSINRLRSKVERPIDPQDRFWDLWEGVKQTFRLFCEQKAADIMGVAVLNGDLFGPQAMRDVDAACILNRHFLHGFAHLSLFKDKRVTRRINYGYLDVEELGSVYESLLEYHPVFKQVDGKTKFDLAFGTERKSTGSYYTRPELVQELIKSGLVPVVEERLEQAKTVEAKEKALLSLKVCDPASGSGHFLLAAARRIGTELAKVRSGEEQPTPSEFRKAVRDVIQHCIYGVDLNPLAVDLCKVALWIEGHNRGYPLTFLDHRIKNGNSLVGIDTLDRLKEGIPNDAFKPVTGDDKEVAKKVKAANKKELKAWVDGQVPLVDDLDEIFKEDLLSFAKEINKIDSIDEHEAGDVSKKQEEYERIRSDRRWHRDWTAANIWTAAFFYPLTDVTDPAIPTQDRLASYLANPGAAHGRLVGKANGLAAKLKFFHWPLEFPDVAEAGGFDVILGNPPWERIKLQEKEFFSLKSPDIAEANKAARTKLIKKLITENPELYNEFINAKHDAESESKYVRASNRFSLTAVGDVNLYSLFTELFRTTINKQGRSGIIVPPGIASDDTTKVFFNSIVDNKNLVSLWGFINEKFIFKNVLHNFKFCALTMSGNSYESDADFIYECQTFEELSNEERHFTLNKYDLEIINPNTKTAPVFFTKKDAELVKKIHGGTPILINEQTNTNPWNISFMTMFHMSNDSHLFLTQAENSSLPLFEGKMFHQYDHRFGTFSGTDGKRMHMLDQPSIEEYSNINYEVQPFYWVLESNVRQALIDKWDKEWLFAFRRFSSRALERSTIATILPYTALGDSVPIFLFKDTPPKEISCVLGNINSIVLDYVVRQKLSGANINYYIIKQFPVLPPDAYSESDIEFIASRVCELVFTSYSVMSFAKDMGFDGPPFRWNEDRRALLRAELDAYYANLYGLTRDELRYILDPQGTYGPDFPGETFRVLKEKELKQYGEYRTQRLVLEAWDRLFGKEG